MGPNQTYKLLHSKGNHLYIYIYTYTHTHTYTKDNLWNGRKYLQMMQ